MTTDQLTTLVDMIGLWDLNAFPLLSSPNETMSQLRRLRDHAHQGELQPLLDTLQNRLHEELVRTFAAATLARHFHDYQQQHHQSHRQHAIAVPILAIVLKEDPCSSVRIAAARALQAIDHPTALPSLIDALINSLDPAFRAILASTIRTQTSTDWEDKVATMLTQLNRQGLWRQHLDAAAILTALFPPPPDIRRDPLALTEKLIEHATHHHQDDRMTGILATLITESCGRNLHRADHIIREYQTNTQTPSAQLEPLRLEINATVTPAELQHTLETRFFTPLNDVQKEIRALWAKTVKSSQRFLRFRLILTSVTQGVGVFFFFISVWRIVFDELSGESLFGVIFGLILIALTYLYRSAISDARQALTDIAIANSAYAAFMHRTLQISNGYAQQFLKGQLTQEDITQSTELIQEALESTVKAMNPQETTLDDLINKL